MRIGELARRSGMSVDTLRFYEKRGLLNESHFRRLESGYRDYDRAALERLTLIKGAQAAGFTLTEILALFDRWENNQLSDEDVAAYLRQKRQQIAERIAALQQVQQVLDEKICAVTGAGAPI